LEHKKSAIYVKKRLNTHSLKAGTYRSDGALSTKNTKKDSHYFILAVPQNKKVAPLPFLGARDFNFF
jgi:hypothetical protein